MSKINIERSYNPWEAERGKFAVVNSDVLTSLGYPSTSGCYGRYAVITYDIGDTSRLPSTLWVGTSTYGFEGVYTFTNADSANILTNPITEIEIKNTTAKSVFFIMSATSYQNTIAYGIEITTGEYYNTKRYMDTFTIACSDGGIVRILGYY